MLEHLPRVGSDYGGLDGQRIAVVGYSHWHKPGEVDDERATLDTVRRVISDEGAGNAPQEDWSRIAFFRQIRNYFGFTLHSAFWPLVAFFNFLPNSVGTGAERFRHGTGGQIDLGRERFLRLLRELAPQKTFVFTRRYWAIVRGASLMELPDGVPQYSRIFKAVELEGSRVFLLRHPQGARKAPMVETVGCLLRS